MNCKEARELIGLYLDSELDTRTAQSIQSHLEQCAGCAAFYHAEQTREAMVCKILQRPAKASPWWKDEEAFVRAAFQNRTRKQATHLAVPGPVSAFAACWRELCWPTPKYYWALGAVWVLLLVLNASAPEAVAKKATFRREISAESKVVLGEQRRELHELLAAPTLSVSHPEPNSIPPHSEWRVYSEMSKPA